MRQVIRVDTRAGVGHCQHGVAARPSYGHPHLVALAAVAGRVAQQVANCLMQSIGISIDDHIRGNVTRHQQTRSVKRGTGSRDRIGYQQTEIKRSATQGQLL